MTDTPIPFATPYHTRLCEHCGQPDIGANRCPHAIDPRYDCPNNPNERRLHERLRKIGR